MASGSDGTGLELQPGYKPSNSFYQELFDTGMFSDLTLTFDNHTFRGHTVVLHKKSKWFAKNAKPNEKIDLDFILRLETGRPMSRFAIFSTVLKFCYTGEFALHEVKRENHESGPSDHSFYQWVHSAADKLQIEDLQELAFDRLRVAYDVLRTKDIKACMVWTEQIHMAEASGWTFADGFIPEARRQARIICEEQIMPTLSAMPTAVAKWKNESPSVPKAASVSRPECVRCGIKLGSETAENSKVCNRCTNSRTSRLLLREIPSRSFHTMSLVLWHCDNCHLTWHAEGIRHKNIPLERCTNCCDSVKPKRELAVTGVEWKCLTCKAIWRISGDWIKPRSPATWECPCCPTSK